VFHAGALPDQKDKVLAIANLLKGGAFDWFEPKMRDYFDNPEHERDDETNRLFSKYSNFTTELRAVFGELDERKTAGRQLLQLRQTGSVSSYTAEFCKIIARLER
jgi:Retrotransposon gag protein